jgi:hypothetical protein
MKPADLPAPLAMLQSIRMAKNGPANSPRDRPPGTKKLPVKSEKGSPGGWRSLLKTHQVLEGGFRSLWSESILDPPAQSVKQLHKILTIC